MERTPTFISVLIAGAGVRTVRTRSTLVTGIHGMVRQISTSNSDGYALPRSGAVYAWGAGGQGELGDGGAAQVSATAHDAVLLTPRRRRHG